MSTVYLIDDDPATLRLFGEVVELTGLNARRYTRASHFFDRVKVVDFGSILVLDLHMPEMDGIEVIRRVAHMNDPPALIVVSGHDVGILHAAEKLARAHGLEVLASLTKPVSVDRFQRLLEQHVSGNNCHLKGAQAVERGITTEEFQQVFRNDQLLLHYQPQIEISTGNLVGVEALVRAQSSAQRLIYPDQFIPLVERNGWMEQLTRWLIAEVIQQQRAWRQAGLWVTVSANISADSITTLTLPEQLTALLTENQLDPTAIILEVTESALMGELARALDILTRLRMKGIGLSIDDFGTGYSSLSQLHRVPFTELKVDRSFVFDMTNDTEAYSIVKTCILLAHELEMRVVAEGVDTQTHLHLLRKMGCDIAQGYFFAKPMPSRELLAWAKEREAVSAV